MKIIKPSYYNKFACIAGACEDSCCIGWNIDVDRKSFNRYRKTQGEYGAILNRNITKNRHTTDKEGKYGKILLSQNGRCSFLNNDNLCNMFINLGEESLCVVCTTYPRRLNKYAHIYERGVTISCPEVARIILSDKESIKFYESEEELTDSDKGIMLTFLNDKENVMVLSHIKKLLIDIAQDRSMPVWKRMLFIKQSTDYIDRMIAEGRYNEKVLSVLRSYIVQSQCGANFDAIQNDYDLKNEIIQEAFDIRNIIEINNSKFSQLFEQTLEFNKLIQQNEIDYSLLCEEFNVAFEEYEYVMEHYIVYYIHTYFMSAVLDSGLSESITEELMLFYIMKYRMIQAYWYYNDKKIELKGLIDIFYSFSRGMEHEGNLRRKVDESGINEQLKQLQCCAVLLK